MGIKSLLKKIFLRDHKKQIVLIEIGLDWFKVAEAVSSPAGCKIMKLLVRKLVSFKEKFAENIAEILRNLGIKTESIITYLPRHLTTIRILKLPSVDKSEIADMVELQTAKQTPYSKEEIISNFKILGPSDKEGYTKVMLVIVRRNIIEERMKLFAEAGLDVQFVGLSSEAVFKLYQRYLTAKHMSFGETVTGFIDMDSNFTDFLFILGGELVFTRSIFIGMDNISAEPQDWKDKLISQIKNSIEIYKQQGFAKEISKIVISDSLEQTTGLAAFLKESLALQVEVLNFVEGASISGEVLKTMPSYSKDVSFLACFGALMGAEEMKLDFLPRQMQMKKKLEQKSKEVIFAGVLVLMCLMVVCAIFAERIYGKSRFLNTLKQQISITDKDATYIEKMKLKIDIIRQCSDKTYSSLNCLRELYKVVPDDIYLTSFTYNNGKEIIINGTSIVMSTVFQFVNILENLDYFEKIKTNYVTKKKKEDKEVVDFELVCAISR